MTDDTAEDWTLITVSYNSSRQLSSCWSQASIGEARWLVVDNASDDTSVAVAQNLGAEVIRLQRNVGFGAANNVALESVNSRWVAFINPDVTVAAPSDLHRLASVASANDGLVAPQLVNPDGTEQPNARGLPFLADKFAHRMGRFPGSNVTDYVRIGFREPTYCAWAIGAAIGGATDLLRDLGGWDPRYFIYYEDHDLGLRAWKAGHPVVLDPQVRWKHEWQRATMRARFTPWKHELRSGGRFYLRYPELFRRRVELGSSSEIAERVWHSAVNPPDTRVTV